MSAKRIITIFALVCGASLSTSASAWFFIFPIPNLGKPAALNTIIEALEKSEETKALAYVSEDKTFGAKYWVWSHFSGHVIQAEADRIALSRCEASLSNAKSQKAGGKELYDFGTKVCELYSFVNKTVSPRATEPLPPPPPAAQPASPALPAPAVTPQVTPTAPTPEQPTIAPASPAPAPLDPTPSVMTAPTPPAATPAVTAPASQPQGQVTKPQSAESPTARRLRELNELRKDGLITEREYNEKRKAILSNM